MDFSPEQKYNLLTAMGYSGSSKAPEMDAFVQSNPRAAALMGKFTRVVKKRTGMAVGGTTTPAAAPKAAPAAAPKAAPAAAPPAMSAGDVLTQAVIQDPTSLTTKADVEKIEVKPDTLIDASVGQDTTKDVAAVTTVQNVDKAVAPKEDAAATYAVTDVAPKVTTATEKVKGETGTIKSQDLVTAAQETKSSLDALKAEQGAGILMNNPVQREVEKGEMISGSSVDAQKVKALTDSIQAAETTPSKQAMVAGQLEGLMKDFEGGKTPAWAAGAMRNAQAMLAQRGLGASSLAGQAVIQAAMESALPIAQADAATRAQFESQNLSNRQQVAMLAAQQRATFLGQEFDQGFQTRVMNAAKISDIANMNFTAEQNIALENSRVANTVNLANLDNKQSVTMAKAAALANLDMANLNNRQQAAVQNAQAFLQMDMTNLDNTQQATMFKAQANINALLTDSAAQNAAKQFNASSVNQTNQFYDTLSTNISQFNASQKNAMEQYNAGETNAAAKFNTQMEAQRNQFNANNGLVIAQANAVWRQNATTINTAAQNQANAASALTMNALTARAMDEVWQKERDHLSYAFTAMEGAKDRATEILLADKAIASGDKAAADAEKTARTAAYVKLVFGDW